MNARYMRFVRMIVRPFFAGSLAATLFASTLAAAEAKATPAPTDAPQANGPTMAVVVINSEGVTGTDAVAGIDAGKAFATILTDKLVDTGKYSMVERESVDKVLDEHKLAATTDFSAADTIKLGHMMNAKYLVMGRVIHLDKVASNAASAGAILSKIPLNIGGAGATADKVHCQIGVRVIETASGRILKSFNFDQAQSGTSFDAGDFGNNSEIYSSKQFTNSVAGRLLNEAALQITTKINDSNFGGPAGPSLEAAIIAVDGDNIIINKGTGDGVTVGMFFDTFHVIVAQDPVSHKSISTDVPDGHIQVISVGPDSSVAHKVSGTPAVSGIAKSAT